MKENVRSLVGGPRTRRGEAAGQLFCAALLGLLAFGITIPSQSLSAGADGFTTFEDQLTYIASLRYFVWDEWRWPLMLTAGLGGEAGTVIVFTDSIPFYALALRLVRAAIGPEFNFLGVWLGLCYALQGLCAVAAVRMWGVTRWAPNLAAAVLALSLPAWLDRVAHAALCLHAILLLAIGLYGWSERSRDSHVALMASVVLSWFALSVNLYLFLMAASFTGALLIRLWRRGWRSWSLVIVAGVLLGGATLEMWALGFFEGHGIAGGFGVFSMNLLSPIHPGRSALLSGLSRHLDATGGQSEGFNYLGLGLLSLAAVALWVVRVRWRSLVSRHWPLALVALCLTIWSLSNRVYCGKLLLIELPAPPDLFAQFRATGRFFWPVAYLILVAAVVLVARTRWRDRSLGLFFIVAASLQWLDTMDVRQDVRRAVSSVPAPAFDRSKWNPLLAAHSRIVVAPTWDCARGSERRLVGEIIYLASIPRTTVMTVHSARPEVVDCTRQAAAFEAGLDLVPDALVVVLDSMGAEIGEVLIGWRCVRFSGGQVCSSVSKARELQAAMGRPYYLERSHSREGEGFADGFETGDTLRWSTSSP